MGMESLSAISGMRNLAVWSVAAALEAAYLAGMVDHHRKRK